MYFRQDLQDSWDLVGYVPFPACLAIASAKLRRLEETEHTQSPSAKKRL